jgi:hypothetical protein
MNLLLSRLDEQQRRWYLAVESERFGYGADRILSSGTEEGAFLAGVWTIVAVAGQTQEHTVTLYGLACRDRAIDRATTVPK